MVAILPILIIILIVGMLIMLYRITIISGKKLITSSRVYMILVGYLITLFISVGMFIASPYPKNALDTELDTEKRPIVYGIPYEILDEGKPIENYDPYKDQEWQFELLGDKLTIQSNTNETVTMMILIEKKQEADGLVEVASYSNATTVGKIDLSDSIEGTDVRFVENNLIKIMEPHVEIDVVSFSKEFVFNQFSKNDSDQDENLFGPEIEIGEKFIYIRIPNNVQVEAYDYLEIEYVNK